jgi:hypothetical protein
MSGLLLRETLRFAMPSTPHLARALAIVAFHLLVEADALRTSSGSPFTSYDGRPQRVSNFEQIRQRLVL